MGNDALSIGEILERILLFADKESLVSCSIISKQWMPFANRILWTSLDSQLPLLELLAPLVLRSTYEETNWGDAYELDTLTFDPTRHISWERFNLYAPYVKQLTIQSDQYPRYDESVVSTIALWRESSSLLPNLEELIVRCGGPYNTFNYPFDFAALFLSRDLKILQVKFDKIGSIDTISSLRKSGTITFDAFLNAIPNRSPGLRTMSLLMTDGDEGLCTVEQGDSHTSWIMSGLKKVLPSLCQLETIILCPMLMQPGLLSATSNLNHIRRMELQCDEHSLCGRNFKDLTSFPFSLTSLDELLISSDFSVTTHFLMAFTSPYLTSLEITSQQIMRTGSLLTLTSTIGKNFPLLARLHLEGPRLGDPELLASGQFCLIDLGTFKPLFALTQMRTFSLDFPHQMQLTVHEFESLVSCWPQIEELHIVPTPGDTPYLMPHVLHVLAHHCPHLCKLTIGVNWDKFDVQIDADMFSATVADILQKPMRLDSLNFGLSPVEESQSAAIAVYLVDLSILSSAIQLPSKVGTAEDALCTVWKDIKKLMTIAGHYRRQIRCLRNELLQSKGIESLDSRSHSTSPSL